MDLWDAAEQGDLERVRALVEQPGGSVHDQDFLGRTPLLLAARYGHIGMARYLLDAGANIDNTTCLGWTALSEACDEGHAGVVSLLLHNGADVTVVALAGWTALLGAAAHGRDAVVPLLLEHGGSDLDAGDLSLGTAVHHACREGGAGVLRQLLEAGADATLRDVEGRTATEVAAASGRHDCVIIMQEWDRAYLLQRLRLLRHVSAKSSSNTPHPGP